MGTGEGIAEGITRNAADLAVVAAGDRAAVGGKYSAEIGNSVFEILAINPITSIF